MAGSGAAVFGVVITYRGGMDGDFEPEGWSAFDDHKGRGVSGNAGCAVFFIALFLIAVISKLSGC